MSSAIGREGGVMLDVTEVRREIEKLARTLTNSELKRITRKCVKPLIDKAKELAPVSKRTKPTYRYLNGKKVATYYKGNLRRSIGILKLSRSWAVYVGHRTDKAGVGGTFKGGRVDGYYGHWVEFNKRKAHIYPAWDATKQMVYNKIASEIKTFLGT